MADDRATEVARRLEAVMREFGLSDKPGEFDSSIHSWRCTYPDRYGPSTCFAEVLDALVRAASYPPGQPDQERIGP